MTAIMRARHALRRDLGLDRIIMNLGRGLRRLEYFDSDPRGRAALGSEIDARRQRAIEGTNGILLVAGLPPLKGIGDW